MFKHKDTGEYTVIHNDNDAIWQFLREQPLLCGFNNKAYDNFILKAVAADFTPQEVKALSDYLIDGGQGWQHPLMRDNPVFVTSFDIRDDIYSPIYRRPENGKLRLKPEYPPITPGSRNLSLTSLAGQLHNQGYTKAEIYKELLYANSQACKPPLPQSEIELIVNSITRYKR